LTHVDLSFVKFLSSLQEVKTSEDFEAAGGSDFNFTVTRTDQSSIELKENGANEQVSFESCQSYTTLALQARLHECTRQIAAIATGLHSIVPRSVFPVLTWDHLERLICGRPEIDLDLLKRHTELASSIDSSAPYIQWFWEVLEELSHEDRRKFIQFTWAQERLPADDAGFSRGGKTTRMLIKPAFVPPGCSPDQQFPRADTCFFNLELPAYSTKAIMRTRITSILLLSAAMDGDMAPASRIASSNLAEHVDVQVLQADDGDHYSSDDDDEEHYDDDMESDDDGFSGSPH
jgi:other hect domain ubiquitin protein ligase E3